MAHLAMRAMLLPEKLKCTSSPVDAPHLLTCACSLWGRPIRHLHMSGAHRGRAKHSNCSTVLCGMTRSALVVDRNFIQFSQLHLPSHVNVYTPYATSIFPAPCQLCWSTLLKTRHHWSLSHPVVAQRHRPIPPISPH